MRHLIAVGLALAILPVGSAAAAEGSTVSGRVHAVGDATGVGFGGVSVDLYDIGDPTDATDDAWVDSTVTADETGAFEFTAVAAGDYYVHTYGGEFSLPDRYSGDVDDATTTVAFAIDGLSPATADVAYTGVRGRVTANSTFEEAYATAYGLVTDPGGDYWAEAAWGSANGAGDYFLALAPGEVRVEIQVARYAPSSSYGSTWSGGGYDLDSAAPIAIGTTTTTAFDAHFTTISGTINVPSGVSLIDGSVNVGVPVEHVEDDGGETYTWWSNEEVSWASLDTTSGAYEAFVAPGSYAVEFAVWSEYEYSSYFHGNTSRVENATLVSPTANTGVSGVDATFRSISGVVSDDSGNPVAGADVSAVEPGGDWWWYGYGATTDAAGAYTLLTWPGSFNVFGSHTKHDCDELYENCTYEWNYETWHGGMRAPETQVDVSGGDATGKDLTFRVIRGRVYEEGDPDTPLGGAWVDAWDSSLDENYGWAQTKSDGTYEMGVPTGSYTVYFSDYDASTDTSWSQYFDRVRSSSLATPVAIGPDTSRSGIDGVKGATLTGDSSISGTIAVPSAIGGHSASVWAYNYDTREYFGPATPDSNGDYTLAVPAGEYLVEVFVSSDDWMTDGYFEKDVIAYPDTGVDVDVDFQTITGTVTKPTGTYGTVQIRQTNHTWNGGWAEVRDNGTYTALAPAGDGVQYYAEFTASRDLETEVAWTYGSGQGYSGEAARAADAQTFPAGATNVNHRFNLMSGSITDAAGTGIQNAEVVAYNSGLTWDGGDWDETRGWAWGTVGGSYGIPMSAGNYKVQFWHYLDDWWDTWETQWFSNKTSYDNADVVTVGATSDRSGVNAVFQRGGITGTVTAADTGSGLANVCVTAWDGADQVGSATTRSDGKYTLYVNAGTYTLKFIHCVSSPVYKDQWFSGVESQTGATPIEVVGKNLTTGKNVVMQTGFVGTSPIVTTTTGGTSATTTYDPRTGQSTTTMPSGSRVDVTASYAPTCESGTVDSASVKLVHNEVEYATTSSGGVYTGTIPASAVTSGPITFTWTCSGTSTSTQVGSIQLYDPSGDVTDAKTGAAVKDATVTLYRIPGWEPKTSSTDNRANTCQSNLSKPSGAAWSQTVTAQNLADAELADPSSGMISPTLNPQKTNGVGRYGWDVAMGCWFVTVEKTGYHKHTSPLVGVPPEVTDLDVALQPIATTTVPSRKASAISSAIKPARVVFGKSTTLSGKLSDNASSAGLAGRSVAIQIRTQKANKTWSAWTKIASATTSSTGTYAYTHKPSKNSQYRAAFAGAGVYTASTSTARGVAVAPKVASKLSATAAKVGHVVKFSGAVKPSLAGKSVQLQRKIGAGKWANVKGKKMALTSKSTYAFKVKLTKKGKTLFRLKVPTYTPYVATLGPQKRVKVS